MSSIDDIQDISPRVQFTAAGGQTVFSVPFPFFVDGDLRIFVGDSEQTLATHYTVTGAGSDDGGEVTFVAGLTAGDLVTIFRDTAIERRTDFQFLGALPSTSINRDLDRLTIIAQEQAERSGRSVVRDVVSGKITQGLEFDGLAGITGLPTPTQSSDAATQAWVAGQVAALGSLSDVPVVGSIAALQALEPGSTAQVLGYTSPGDGGGGLFYWDAASTEDEDGGTIFESGAGGDGRWKRGYAGEVSARQFGADNDVDATAKIQSAIDFSLYARDGDAAGARVLIDVERVVSDDTIHVGYGTNFKGTYVRGLGPSYRGVTKDFVGTSIVSSVTAKPAVSLQGGRLTSVTDLALIGVARDVLRDLDTRDPDVGLSESAWDAALVSAGVTPGRRYAPHAGYAIDPYSGDRPGVSYPDVTYPEFLGQVEQYGKNLSVNLTIGGIVNGFEVGVVSQPSDVDGNADFTKLRDMMIEFCKYGVSIGNSQARNTDLSGVLFNRVYSCLVNNIHGRQIGRFGSSITNLHGFGFIFQIFEFTRMSRAGTTVFAAPYFESLFRIGKFTASATDSEHLKFENGFFNFLIPASLDRFAVAGNLIAGVATQDTIEFSGCTLRPDRVSSFALGRVIMTDNTQTAPRTLALKAYEAFALNSLAGGFALDPLVKFPIKVNMRSYNLQTLARSANVSTNSDFALTDRDNCIPNRVTSGRSSVSGNWTNKPVLSFALVAANRTSVSRSDRAVTFTNIRISTATSNVDRHYNEGYLPGGVLIHRESGTVMFIRSVDLDTGVTIAEMQNNYVEDGADGYDIWDSTFNPATDTWYCINPLVYSPGRMLWGTLTAGSSVITNVRSAGGANLTNYGLVVGDKLAGDLYPDAPFLGSNKLTISAIDTTAGTITLSGNAEFSATHWAMPFWYRTPPANEASR
jgi:hypothetical protein